MAKNRPTSPQVAAALKEARLAKGLAQEALAERACMAPSYVGLLENAKRRPSIEMLIKPAHALEIRPGELVDRIDALREAAETLPQGESETS